MRGDSEAVKPWQQNVKAAPASTIRATLQGRKGTAARQALRQTLRERRCAHSGRANRRDILFGWHGLDSAAVYA